MKKPAVPNADPQTLAVLHKAGRVWRALIASTRTGQPAIAAKEEFSAGATGRLDNWLDQHSPGAVLCVLPASAVICRNCPLPDAPPDQLAQALHLQAEAHLLGIAPPHRLSMAVLPNASGETTRTGLVLAWPEAAEFDAPPTTRPVQYVPDIAALAAVLNGQRPNESLMWLDRDDGSIALAITHAGGAVFRAVREDSQAADNWPRQISRIAAETGLSVGHTGPFIEALACDAQQKAATLGAGDARLFLPAELIAAASARLQGAGTDAGFWSRYGIAAGAILARTGPLAPLTRLHRAAPVEQPSRIGRILEKLSTPTAAAVVVVACVVVLMFGPLLFSGLRYIALKVRHGDLTEELRAANDARNQVAVYKELQKQKTWPMTKLLADITAMTPIGIELETIRIEGGKDFAVSGTALTTSDGKTPAQLVALLQENLGRGRMFSDVAVNAGKTDNLGRYKFDLNAKVSKPYYAMKLDEELDYAATPYAVRLYGPRAAEPGTAPASEPQALAQAPSNSPPIPTVPDEFVDPENEPDRGGIGTNGSVGDDPTRRGEVSMAAPSAAPPPLDVEQIKVMSRAELKDALVKISKARQNHALEDDVQKRLKAEHEMVLEYLRKATS